MPTYILVSNLTDRGRRRSSAIRRASRRSTRNLKRPLALP